MRIRGVLVASLFAAPLAVGPIGCGKIAEKIQQKAVEKAVEKTIEAKSGGEAKVDLSGKSVSGTFKNGKQVTGIGEGATLPDDFPKQVPVYPGAKLQISHADKSGDPKYALVFDAPDAPDKVVAYYKDELKSFNLEQDIAGEGARVLLFVDKVQAKLNVHLSLSKAKDDITTNVMLNVETLR